MKSMDGIGAEASYIDMVYSNEPTRGW